MKQTVFYFNLLIACFLVNGVFSAAEVLVEERRNATHVVAPAPQVSDENLYTSAAQFEREGNLREYFKVCDRAAAQNHAWALNKMGAIYQFGLSDATGLIIIKNIDKAIEYYQQAVAQYPEFALAKENLERAISARDAAQATAQKYLQALDDDD